MRKHILLIGFTLFISILASGQEKRKDAEFEQIKIKYTLNKDGSIEYNYHKELKVYSIQSFSRFYGETFIVYNPKFQSLKVNESYTILPDGRKLINPANSFNEVLPAGCTNCARYNRMKEMVVTHTGLEPNATIALDYTITSKPKFMPELMDIIYFAEYVPVKNYDITVVVPKDRELYSTMLGIRLAPEVSKDRENNIYHWNIPNIEQSHSDYYKPHNTNIYPTLKFSTIKDMQHAYFKFVNQEGFKQNELPEAKAALKDIIDNKTTELDKAIAVRDYVVDNIITNDVDIKYLNYMIAPPSVTWNASCGNEAEKAVLLSALLNTLGLSSYPVGLVHESLHNDYIGTLAAIEHWGVKTMIDGHSYIFSPISKTNRSIESLYNGYTIYTFSSEVENFRANLIKPVDNMIEMSCNIDLNAKGNASNIAITATSDKFNSFSFSNDNAGKIIKNTKVELERIKNREQTVSGQFAIVGDNTKQISEGYYEISLPETTLGLEIIPSLLSTKRDIPLHCSKTNESYTYKINLPSETKYVGEDININIETSFGKMHISVTATDDGEVQIIKSLLINKEIINYNEYKDFRNMMIEWNNQRYKKITFKDK